MLASHSMINFPGIVAQNAQWCPAADAPQVSKSEGLAGL
jgi:hypothetical protein